MRFTSTVLVLVGALLSIAKADFSQYVAELPACGLLCIEKALNSSICSLTNTTCLCTNAAFTAASKICVQSSCTVIESLAVAKVNEQGCGITPTSSENEFRAVALSACILAEICVILRMWVKIFVVKQVSLDDWFIILAGVMTIPYLYLHMTIADLGFGKDIWDISSDNLYKLFRLFVVDQCFYLAMLIVTKISILLFLAKIFPSRTFRIACYGVGTFTMVFGVIIIFVTIFQCRPVAYAWTKWDGNLNGKCNNVNLQTYIAGGINMCQDFVILCLPIPSLWNLQVSTKKRIQLLIMFSLGVFVTVTSIVRLPYLVPLGRTSNPTKDYVKLTAWSIWETELAMVCACMPSIRHLLTHYFPSIFRSTVKNSSGKSDPRIWQVRSFKIESKLRNNHEFHELDERTLGGGTSNVSLNSAEQAIDPSKNNSRSSHKSVSESQRHMIDNDYDSESKEQVHAHVSTGLYA